MPPVVVRQVRNGIVESVHRGDIVEVDAAGRMLHLLGDPDRIVNLRSAMKPFGLIALLRAGGRREFDLTGEELAIMTSSHSGEDVHVRTVQALFRRLGIAAVGARVRHRGDAARRPHRRRGSRATASGRRPCRHMCSGQHSVFILLAKLGGWELETYWQDDHPAQAAVREAIGGRVRASIPTRIETGIDGCGILTYAFPLREVARAFAILADPEALPAGDPRASLAPYYVEIREAMTAYPELVAGTRERLDTSLMKATSGRLVSKSGAEGLRGIGILRGQRQRRVRRRVGHGDQDRGRRRQGSGPVGRDGRGAPPGRRLEGQAQRVLARYHRPVLLDPHGRQAAEAIPEFELAPVGELVV